LLFFVFFPAHFSCSYFIIILNKQVNGYFTYNEKFSAAVPALLVLASSPNTALRAQPSFLDFILADAKESIE